MPAKVFISCGQRPPRETEIAAKVAKLLKEDFYLDSYTAFKIQGFEDVMKITNHLASCDYYLFIDFRRNADDSDSLCCSMFTHQEFALAYHLGFETNIALQEKGCPHPPLGFAGYILSNPEVFCSEEELFKKIRQLVTERKWIPTYSRHLIAERVYKIPHIMCYGDHTGVRNDWIYHCYIANKRNEKAAMNTLAVLKSIQLADGTIINPDSMHLKWAYQGGYARTIFPKTEASFDLLGISAENPTLVYLHSAADGHPRQPIISTIGKHILSYYVFAEGFPSLEFKIELFLTGDIDTTPELCFRSSELLASSIAEGGVIFPYSG